MVIATDELDNRPDWRSVTSQATALNMASNSVSLFANTHDTLVANFTPPYPSWISDMRAEAKCKWRRRSASQPRLQSQYIPSAI